MAKEDLSQKRDISISGDQSSGGDSQGSTLRPMLIAGLIFVILGGIVIMIFV